MPHAIHRRDLIKIGAAAALAGQTGFAATDAPRFFTSAEFTMVDELSEMIIPADNHSPGAHAANVTEYIDARLAEAFEPQQQEKWRAGLQAVDGLSNKLHGHPFLSASPEERVAVLSRMAENETHPKTPDQVFFGELKAATAHAYYTSKIGIHQEIEYKGNTLLQEFVGYELK